MASDVRPSYYCGASGCGADLAECRRAVTRGWGDAAWAGCGSGAAEAMLRQGSYSLCTTIGQGWLPSWPEGFRLNKYGRTAKLRREEVRGAQQQGNRFDWFDCRRLRQLCAASLAVRPQSCHTVTGRL